MTRPLIFILLLLTAAHSYGRTCTTTADGDWNDTGMWTCSPGPSFTADDTIVIAHDITRGSAINLSGSTVLIIQANNTLNVTGSISTTSANVKLEIYGTVSSSASFTAQGGAINIYSGGTLSITGAGNDYILASGSGKSGSTSVTNIYNGGTLNVADDITYNSSNSTIIQHGGTINATSISIAGTADNTATSFGGTVNLSGAFTTGSAARTVTISGTLNAASFTTAQATVNISGTMNLTGNFTSTGGSIINITGTINGQDLLATGGGTFTGTPTLNLRDLRFGWGTTPYGSGATFSGSVNFTGGAITLSRHLAIAGGAVITIGSTVSVGENFYGGGTNGITFNGISRFYGDFYKTGSGAISMNAHVTVDGFADLTNGLTGSAADLLIADGVMFQVSRLFVTGNFKTVVNGYLNVINDIRMGTSRTDGGTSVGGSVSITGTGVVGWSPGNLFSNNSSDTYIGCVGHTSSSLRYGDGPLSINYPDPPENPLNLTTCDAGTILPVTFMSFQGLAEGRTVFLTWATATEKDNHEFIIEKSDESGDFIPVGSVQGNGTSQSINSYSFAYTGTGGYFRLKQVDFDGQFEYSVVIYVETRQAEQLKVFPNPLDGNNFHIQVNSELAGPITVLVYNLAGSVFFHQTLNQSEGTLELQISNNMVAGLYLIEVRTADKVLYERLVVK